MKMAGLGVNQTKVIAASAYVGSCTLTKELVAALLGVDVDTFEPSQVAALLSAHEVVTGKAHSLSSPRNRYSRNTLPNAIRLCLNI